MSCSIAGCSSKSEHNSSKKTIDNATGWELADIIVEEVAKKMPEFDDYSVKITDYGAEVVTEPITDKKQEASLAKKNIQAIHKAIADVSAHKGKDGKSGGKVIIPKGYTYTAAIHLQDNVNLHLEDGANVMFTTDYDQYLPTVRTRWEGVECYNYSPMVYAYQKKNIAITGNGLLDAQASKEQYWLPWKNDDYLPEEQQDADRAELFRMGEEGVPVEERQFGGGHYLRPCFLQTMECENVLIENITIKNSPFWMVHPVETNYLTVRGITVDSHGYNNDGVNPESCKNVVIENCTFKTGDDCIAVKSGRNADGRNNAIPSENIVAQNNTYVTGKGACGTIGSEMSGDIRNVFFRDNVSESTVEHLQAISLKTNGDRGGIIENIYFKGIEANNTIDRAVLITMFYEEGDTKVTTPKIRNIFVEDSTFKCINTEDAKDVISIWGFERSMIENVQFKNCTFEGSKYGLNLHNVKDIRFDNCSINGEKLPEGIFKPEEHTSLINPEVLRNRITLGYSCGAAESTLNPHFLVSDSADGQFTELKVEENQFFCKVESNGSEVILADADETKYYKFALTINGVEWESEVLHCETN